jgi:hypothetical protein
MTHLTRRVPFRLRILQADLDLAGREVPASVAMTFLAAAQSFQPQSNCSFCVQTMDINSNLNITSGARTHQAKINDPKAASRPEVVEKMVTTARDVH